jgi:hypothetical protein
MYKKLVNAQPSPDGSPEHMHWTAAAASRAMSCGVWGGMQAIVDRITQLADVAGQAGVQARARSQFFLGGFWTPEIS